MKKITHGTGITAHEVDQYDTSDPKDLEKMREDAINYRKEIERCGSDFLAVCDPILRVCRETLSDLRPGKKDWSSVKDDSEEDFAHKIESSILAASVNMKNGDSDQGMVFAFLAGAMHERSKIKIRWERDALRGEKVAGGSRNAAHATNAAHEPMRDRRFRRMAELVPSLAVENAARQCDAEGLGSWQAIVKQWNRYPELRQKLNRDT